jgi:hypothetical protein
VDAGRALNPLGILPMKNPKFAANIAVFTRFASRQTKTVYARLIEWFSNDTIPARALLMIGLGMPAGTTLWMLLVSSIFKGPKARGIFS